jgi:hypothetical protein
MANVAPANVVLRNSDTYPLGDRFQKDMMESQGDYAVTLAGNGDGTVGNDIPASAFGLQFIHSVTDVVKTDNTLVLSAAPKADGSGILLKAAGSNAPAQYTGVFNMRVKGRIL